MGQLPKNVEAIYRAIRSCYESNRMKNVLRSREGWLHLAISDLALLLDEDAEIRYADIVINEYDGPLAPYDFSLLIFTDAHFLQVEGRWDDPDTQDRVTTMKARPALASLSVRAEVPDNAELDITPWPGTITVSMEFSDGAKLTLPRDPNNATRSCRENLRTLIPSLRQDLERTRAK